MTKIATKPAAGKSAATEAPKMDPRLRGTVSYEPGKNGELGHYKAKIRCPDGARPTIHFDPGPQSPQAEARAKDKALAWTERVWREGITGEQLGLVRRRDVKREVVTVPESETCADWWDRYLKHREGLGQASVKDARGRVTKWILPLLVGRTMRSITREDLEAVVRHLDDVVRRGDISWKTAGNVWGECTSAFKQACVSKIAELRVRDDNPADKVQGPDGGIEKAKPILYPDEFLALVSCKHVPLNRRRLYAVATYTGARSNEVAALRASDVDLVHGRVSISKQVDRATGLDKKKTKTGRARAFDIEPNLLPLLKALIEERPAGRLLHMPPHEDRAELLRKDLTRAGVTRADLFIEDDPQRDWIKLHNLRDTGLTWMAVRGDDPLRIQWRGGHTDFAMTQGYIAAGRNLGAGFGVPFPELPASLFGDDGAECALEAGERAAAEPDGAELEAGEGAAAEADDGAELDAGEGPAEAFDDDRSDATSDDLDDEIGPENGPRSVRQKVERLETGLVSSLSMATPPGIEPGLPA